MQYSSIYDRPQRSRGRPTTCKLSDEEKRERLRQNFQKYYYAGPERERERKQREYARKR